MNKNLKPEWCSKFPKYTRDWSGMTWIVIIVVLVLIHNMSLNLPKVKDENNKYVMSSLAQLLWLVSLVGLVLSVVMLYCKYGNKPMMG